MGRLGAHLCDDGALLVVASLRTAGLIAEQATFGLHHDGRAYGGHVAGQHHAHMVGLFIDIFTRAGRSMGMPAFRQAAPSAVTMSP
jgi:hypothetical protein